MSHTLSQLMQFIEENDIKSFAWPSAICSAVQKNIAIMASHLPHAVESGISFDASAIAGFANVAESDLFLVPDLDTFVILPWAAQRGLRGPVLLQHQISGRPPIRG